MSRIGFSAVSHGLRQKDAAVSLVHKSPCTIKKKVQEHWPNKRRKGYTDTNSDRNTKFQADVTFNKPRKCDFGGLMKSSTVIGSNNFPIEQCSMYFLSNTNYLGWLRMLRQEFHLKELLRYFPTHTHARTHLCVYNNKVSIASNHQPTIIVTFYQLY